MMVGLLPMALFLLPVHRHHFHCHYYPLLLVLALLHVALLPLVDRNVNALDLVGRSLHKTGGCWDHNNFLHHHHHHSPEDHHSWGHGNPRCNKANEEKSRVNIGYILKVKERE